MLLYCKDVKLLIYPLFRGVFRAGGCPKHIECKLLKVSAMDDEAGKLAAPEEEAYRLFNLIVSTEPYSYERRKALRYIRSIIPGTRVFSEEQSLLLLKTPLDPYEAVRKLSKGAVGEPILRMIPIDINTPPYPSIVASYASKLVEERAKPNDTFAVKIEGHLYDERTGRKLHKLDAIKTIAERIKLQVNLGNPRILVLVKVVAISRAQRYAAIMVAPPCAIYSRAKNTNVCYVDFKR